MSLLLLLRRSQPTITGSLATTETGADSASISGKVIVSGSINATESGNDSAAISGKVLISGSLAATESGSDTAALSGKVIVFGSLSATESGSDSASISGNVLVSGSISATESGVDVAAILGKIFVSGSLNASETGQDIANFYGSALPPVTGSLDATEVGQDTASFISGKPVEPPKAGGLVAFSSRSELLKAANKLLGFLEDPVVKKTPKLKRIIKRLEEAEKPNEEILVRAAEEAISALETQEKTAEFMVEIRQIRQIINNLEAIKQQVEDEDEESLLLLM